MAAMTTANGGPANEGLANEGLVREGLAANGERATGTFTVKRGLADMLRGGVIMDVVNAEQAKIAEDAGAVAGMSDPALIEGIQQAVTIPVMAKARIGHFAEAQVLQALGVDYIDESEVLTPA